MFWWKDGPARLDIFATLDLSELEPPPALSLLSVILPACNEQERIGAVIEHLHGELDRACVPHEIIVVDDGSTDGTWRALERIAPSIPELVAVKNPGPHGLGHCLRLGIEIMRGDAIVTMRADGSQNHRDVVRYWKLLNDGYECVFGSRFMRGAAGIDERPGRLILSRMINFLIRLVFNFRLNDTTNLFKAYRKSVVEGCYPLVSPHAAMEIPLKAIGRGYSWISVPIVWQDGRSVRSGLRTRQFGFSGLSLCFYLLLEKLLSKGGAWKNQGLPSQG